MEQLTVGVIGSSRKENEHRVPIHPDHLRAIAPALRTDFRADPLLFMSAPRNPWT